MRRKFNGKLAMVCGVILAAATLTSCGSVSSGSSTSSRPTGSLITIVQDAPLCDAISANVTLSSLTLTPTNGGNPVGYIANTPNLPHPFG